MHTLPGNQRLDYVAFFKWVCDHQDRPVREKAREFFGVSERAIREALGIFVSAGWFDERSLAQRGAPKRYRLTSDGRTLRDAGMRMRTRIDMARAKHGTSYSRGSSARTAKPEAQATERQSRSFPMITSEERALTPPSRPAQVPCPSCTRKMEEGADECGDCQNRRAVKQIIAADRARAYGHDSGTGGPAPTSPPTERRPVSSGTRS